MAEEFYDDVSPYLLPDLYQFAYLVSRFKAQHIYPDLSEHQR